MEESTTQVGAIAIMVALRQIAGQAFLRTQFQSDTGAYILREAPA